MPELAAVGEVDDPEVEPVTIPIVAYTIKTGKKVVEKFRFKPEMPPGVLAYVERLGGQLQLDASRVGDGAVNSALVCLQDCLMADDKVGWHEWLGRDDLVIKADTIVEVLGALFEHYAGRPTQPRSGSSSTGSRSGRTSRAARASTE